ncbi:MAG: sugar phosphate nucleotidyltransferase [Chthoniobacterales bacterium]
MIRQAFVLGAGLGTRLRPLTDDLPKPLVPIFQKPLITFALDHLAAAGVTSFVINTHHLPQHFENLFAEGHYGQLPVRLVHEPILLETGGGIKNAQPLLGDEPFLVYSGDVLTDLSLAPLIDEHLRCGNDVTLALRDTGVAANLAFRDGRVIDISNRYGHPGTFDYANVSVWNPSIFARIPAGQKISFIPVLGEWIGAGGKIGGVISSEGRWFNLSSRQEYFAVHRTIADEHWRPAYVRAPEWPERVAPDAKVDPSAKIDERSVIGAGSRVGSGAVVRDSILWPGAQISSHAQINGCIVRTHRRAEGVQSDAVI